MDKNGRLFGKISIIDVLATVIIIAVAAGAVYKFVSPDTNLNASEKTVCYTLKINGVRSFTYDYYIKEADLKCFDRNTGTYLGVIKNVRQEPYIEAVTRSDGTIVQVEMPDIIIIYLDIEVEGSESETAYFAEGTYEIKEGANLHLNTKYVDVRTTVMNVYSR